MKFIKVQVVKHLDCFDAIMKSDDVIEGDKSGVICDFLKIVEIDMVDTAVDIHQNITLFGGVGSTTTRGRIQKFNNKYGPDQVSSGAASSSAD